MSPTHHMVKMELGNGVTEGCHVQFFTAEGLHHGAPQGYGFVQKLRAVGDAQLVNFTYADPTRD